MTAIILAPAALPGLVIGVALLNLFGDIHITLSLLTVTIGHVIYTLPFFYLILSARLRRFDPTLEEVATDMGAGPVQRFRRVTAPLIAAGHRRVGIRGPRALLGRVPDHLLHDRRPEHAPAGDLVPGPRCRSTRPSTRSGR